MRTPAMRQAVAALVMLVLALAGAGRGLATAPDLHPFSAPIPGVVAPICHADGRPIDPGGPGHHDCCDECALFAPAVLSVSPDIPVVSPLTHDMVRSTVAGWTANLSRARSPRQSQGPPAA